MPDEPDDFALTVESVFTSGRVGLVVIGPIESGAIRDGDRVDLWDGDSRVATAEVTVESVRAPGADPRTIALRLRGMSNPRAVVAGLVVRKWGEIAPPASELDLAIREAVARGFAPYQGYTLECIWNAGADMWFTEVTPTSPGAAFLSVAHYGDTLYWAIGNAWIEYFSIRDAEVPEFVAEVARCVAAGRVEETGLPRMAVVRVRSEAGIVINGGPMRLPWPWAWRRKRRYAAYPAKG